MIHLLSQTWKLSDVLMVGMIRANAAAAAVLDQALVAGGDPDHDDEDGAQVLDTVGRRGGHEALGVAGLIVLAVFGLATAL